MNVSVEINRDIDKFKESVVLGLTAKQLIASVLSILVGGTIVVLTYKKVGFTLSAYISIPIVAPIALSGFYSFNGMSFMQMMKKRIKFMFKVKPLVYKSTENVKELKEVATVMGGDPELIMAAGPDVIFIRRKLNGVIFRWI